MFYLALFRHLALHLATLLLTFHHWLALLLYWRLATTIVATFVSLLGGSLTIVADTFSSTSIGGSLRSWLTPRLFFLLSVFR